MILYSEKKIQMTQRRLSEFSTIMFISDYMPRFCAIGYIFPSHPVLYDRLCGQRVFTAKHKRWQPYYFAYWQLYLAIFGHSKVSKLMSNQTSKGAFVIVSCIIIRMWWRTFFLLILSQNPTILCLTCFLDLFQPQAGAVDHLQQFKGG